MGADASDEVLMERFCDGDEAAFDALFARHAGDLQRFLLRMVRDRPLAEDLTQATFLSLVRARGRYERGSKFTTWLYAIAVNAARDSQRHKRRHPEDVTSDGVALEEAVSPMVRDPGLERVVQEALAQLPPQQREAVVLHRFQGLSFSEIAEALGTSVGAVKVRAHRGYEKLRGLLSGLEKEGET